MQRFGVFSGTVGSEEIVRVWLAVQQFPCEVLGLHDVKNRGMRLPVSLVKGGFTCSNTKYRAIIWF
jgi:hypothetical protein